jgi:hypothetical protein
VKEMEIARQVRMGEDRDAIQEEYESEPLTDFDDSNRSEEEESESGDADLFMVKPRSTTGSQIPKGSRMPASAPEAMKCIEEDAAAPTEEVKWARVEKHSGTPQMPSSLERGKDESGKRTGPEVLLMTPDVTDPPRDLQDAVPRELAGSALGLGHAMGDGLRSPPGVRWFERFGPPPIGWASR